MQSHFGVYLGPNSEARVGPRPNSRINMFRQITGCRKNRLAKAATIGGIFSICHVSSKASAFDPQAVRGGCDISSLYCLDILARVHCDRNLNEKEVVRDWVPNQPSAMLDVVQAVKTLLHH